MIREIPFTHNDKPAMLATIARLLDTNTQFQVAPVNTDGVVNFRLAYPATDDREPTREAA